MKVKDICKKVKNKISKSKAYEAINYFFYSKEFLIWYKSNADKDFSALDGKLDKKWYYIKKFDEVINNDRQEY